MKLRHFREAVFDEFGPRLENATPANVREFLDRMQAVEHEAGTTGTLPGRHVLNEHATSYEQIIKEFFGSVLRMPDDEAIITLWTMAVEMSFSALESQYEEIFRPLFRDFDSD